MLTNNLLCIIINIWQGYIYIQHHTDCKVKVGKTHAEKKSQEKTNLVLTQGLKYFTATSCENNTSAMMFY